MREARCDYQRSLCVGRLATIFMLLVTVGTLWGQEYHPQDYVPLEVGNTWFYRHRYINPHPDRFPIAGYEDADLSEIPDSLVVVIKQEVPIAITHTEQIDGHSYYVFSDVAYEWPPVPPFALVGVKVRWTEDGRLLVRRSGTEFALYDFSSDRQNPSRYSIEYGIPDLGGFTRVSGSYMPSWGYPFNRTGRRCACGVRQPATGGSPRPALGSRGALVVSAERATLFAADGSR